MTEAEGFELYRNSLKVSQEMRASIEWITSRLRDTEDMQEVVTLVDAAYHLMGVYTSIADVLAGIGGLESTIIWAALLKDGDALQSAIDESAQEVLNALVRLDAPESVTTQITVELNQHFKRTRGHDHP